MERLQGKQILLGVTGGIAAYKSAELVRGLRREGATVRVVTTRAAEAFVTPLTLQALSGYPVRRELFDPEAEAGMDHIALARWADLVLIAPASADVLARLAAGLADDLLTTLCLATTAPLALVPAMNHRMWQAAATQANVERLQQRGAYLLGPAEGEQACGESGPGRMLEPAQLVAWAGDFLAPGPLRGMRVVITAGPTREAIDPVRFISNHSSGKMGYAIAQAAAEAGAEVTLVSGPVGLPIPSGVRRITVESAAEMLAAVKSYPCDVFIATAAVADYRPDAVAPAKLKKSAEHLTLSLQRNPDILAQVAASTPAPFTVGFAAETDDLELNARNKLETKKLDMVAANWVGDRADGGGFGSDRNALLVLSRDGTVVSLPTASKIALARQLVALVAEQFVTTRRNS